MLSTLIYRNEKVDLKEVTNTLLSKERKLSDESTETTDVSTLTTVGNWKKINSKNK